VQQCIALFLIIQPAESFLNFVMLTEAGAFRTPYMIFMESIQAGIHSQDWNLVSKSVEGMSRETIKQAGSARRQWILWNV